MAIYTKLNPPSGFYVYAYLRDDGSPYYIGKGHGTRAWAKSDRTVFPKPDFSNIVILEQNLTDLGSLAIERRMIRWYGRIDLGTGILHNKTDGGDGNCGWVQPEYVKQKISKSKIGKSIWSEEDRAMMSKNRSGEGHWNYGKTTATDVRQKISEGVKKRNTVRPIKVRSYILIDTITKEEWTFNKHNAKEVFNSLGINKNGLFWSVRYTKDKLYKQRYTVIF